MFSGEVLVGGAVSVVLGRIVREGKLKSKAGQRLNLGLAAFGFGSIVNSILGFDVLRMAGIATGSILGGAMLGICGALRA